MHVIRVVNVVSNKVINECGSSPFWIVRQRSSVGTVSFRTTRPTNMYDWFFNRLGPTRDFARPWIESFFILLYFFLFIDS